MKKIDVSTLKTKKQFHAAHKKLWNRIIKLTRKKFQYLPYLKIDAFKILFDEIVFFYCFGCAWSVKITGNCDCRKCLFKRKNKYTDYCLDGQWLDAKITYNSNDLSAKIAAAKAIRDFPVK